MSAPIDILSDADLPGGSGGAPPASVEKVFDFSADPIPVSATDLFIQVVYRGGLGMPVPAAMPRALERVPAAEVSVSPSLSLMVRPGSVGIHTRKIAIFIADGVDGESVRTIEAALKAEAARPVLVGPRVGPFKAADVRVLFSRDPIRL